MIQNVIISPIDKISNMQRKYLKKKPLSTRKKIGQFFTGSVISNYMASLIIKPNNLAVRILDAGAGNGILTASCALKCLNFGCSNVHAVLYESDANALPNLTYALNTIRELFEQRQCRFTFDIICEDFVLARPDKNNILEKFDVAIINPPYFKYSVKYSPYSKAASDLYIGDPNIYASFMAIVTASLKEGGQLVSITPRSFTNGLYFKGFRKYLLSQCSIKLIHIFKHRDKLFLNEESNILQENIICYFIKGANQNSIVIRSSDCDASINAAEERTYSNNLIIDGSNNQIIIRIPETAQEAQILQQAETLNGTFEGAGYFISTGRVVEHRARNFITEKNYTINSIPLYRPHNIKQLTASWTGEKPKDVSFLLSNGHEKHTMRNGTYVLLKRFSSKGEKRRLVAGVHLESAHNCDFIGFGNKTNYIGLMNGKLLITEAYGLATIFNSTFMDKYFRCISGNTQVNATEIRVMKFPTRRQVIEIGKLILKAKNPNTTDIDLIVNKVLRLNNFTYEV